MNLQKWLNDGRLSKHNTSEEELDALRSAVQRNLKDAAIEVLSPDNRFGLAYEAALILAKMVIAVSGYRVRGHGAHQTTFEALEEVVGERVVVFSTYFDRCRRLRNSISYDAADVVSEVEVDELLVKVKEFEVLVGDWVKGHP